MLAKIKLNKRSEKQDEKKERLTLVNLGFRNAEGRNSILEKRMKENGPAENVKKKKKLSNLHTTSPTKGMKKQSQSAEKKKDFCSVRQNGKMEISKGIGETERRWNIFPAMLKDVKSTRVGRIGQSTHIGIP